MKTFRTLLIAAASVSLAACMTPKDEGTSPKIVSTGAAVIATPATVTTVALVSAAVSTSASTVSTTSTAAAAATPAGGESNILGLKRPVYDKKNPNWKFGVMDPGTARFDSKKDYFVTIHTTLGDITAKFFPEIAPHHVTAFINLSEIGYYNDCPFHRIIPGFMMQGGDPSGQGNAGPSYHLGQEFSVRKHVKGILSMARTPDPNSAGSQFFIMFGPYPSLDNQYTIFGSVTKGLDVVDKFEKIGSQGGRPASIEKIKSVDVFTKDK